MGTQHPSERPATSNTLRRVGDWSAEEERIVRAALAELPGEGVVLLGAGTLTELLAARLPFGCGYTVVTNSVSSALLLADRGDITLYLTGGPLHRRAGATLAVPGELEGLSADIAFVAPEGISVSRGLTSGDSSEGKCQRAMMDTARKIVVLADQAEVGNDREFRFARLDEVDCLVTSADLAPKVSAALRARVSLLLQA
ncbi:DeoR/GlpR family DNA-binding transcription regulator [Nocardiopsis sp. CNT312]|uniref:DeoR/GlpR family DNA-binding transcription regulator n=1 Tax=Nocardiopsis sp. CNT312 TaxID=1137268 RepID=UPI0004B9CED2|nr:DeoR family transcriptional regulator [Nocardiopsis sp. CNT312]